MTNKQEVQISNMNHDVHLPAPGNPTQQEQGGHFEVSVLRKKLNNLIDQSSELQTASSTNKTAINNNKSTDKIISNKINAIKEIKLLDSFGTEQKEGLNRNQSNSKNNLTGLNNRDRDSPLKNRDISRERQNQQKEIDRINKILNDVSFRSNSNQRPGMENRLAPIKGQQRHASNGRQTNSEMDRQLFDRHAQHGHPQGGMDTDKSAIRVGEIGTETNADHHNKVNLQPITQINIVNSRKYLTEEAKLPEIKRPSNNRYKEKSALRKNNMPQNERSNSNIRNSNFNKYKNNRQIEIRSISVAASNQSNIKHPYLTNQLDSSFLKIDSNTSPLRKQ